MSDFLVKSYIFSAGFFFMTRQSMKCVLRSPVSRKQIASSRYAHEKSRNVAYCYIHDTKSVIMIISTSDCLSAEFRNPRGFLSLKANELSRLGGGGKGGGKG